jgi:hypothetical protein
MTISPPAGFIRAASLAVVAVCATSGGPPLALAAPIGEAFNPLVGTLSTKAEPTFRGGELVGCTLVYAALAKDFIYKQGAFIAIRGSFGLVAESRNVGVTLKVVVQDIDPDTAPLKPTTAYLVSGNGTSKHALISAASSDTDGGFSAIFKAEQTLEMLLQGISDDKVTVAFARTVGGTDMKVSVETDVVETASDGKRMRSPEPAISFLECSNSLMETVRKVRGVN